MENKFNSTGNWLITVDLDGTFLSEPTDSAHENNIQYHPHNLKVVKKLIELGHKVAIVTGRPWKDTKAVYESIGLESVIANYNGSHIHFPNKENEFASLTYSINKEILNDVYLDPSLANGVASSILFETIDTTYTTDTQNDLSSKITGDRPGIVVKEWKVGEPFEGTPLSSLISIDLEKTDDPYEILHSLNRKFGNALFFRFWDYRTADKPWLMLEINQKTSNKGTAMKHIAQYYNIPLSRTISFGDGLNDREMLIEAAVGVAMKNGKGTVKTYADDITDYTNSEAGVGRYLEEFFNLID